MFRIDPEDGDMDVDEDDNDDSCDAKDLHGAMQQLQKNKPDTQTIYVVLPPRFSWLVCEYCRHRMRWAGEHGERCKVRDTEVCIVHMHMYIQVTQYSWYKHMYICTK